MSENTPYRGRRAHSRRDWLQRVAALGVLALVILLVAAGCGNSSNGPGVANLDPTGTTAGSAVASPTSTSAAGDPAAYSQCMRSHGIADFPDPNSQGQIGLKMQPGSDLDPNNPTFQTAQTACQSLRPAPSAAQQQQSRDQMLKYAQCMRQNGIADFPDPSADGRLQISGGQGSDLDPNSPAFKAAQDACKSLLPQGGKGSSVSNNSGGGQ